MPQAWTSRWGRSIAYDEPRRDCGSLARPVALRCRPGHCDCEQPWPRRALGRPVGTQDPERSHLVAAEVPRRPSMEHRKIPNRIEVNESCFLLESRKLQVLLHSLAQLSHRSSFIRHKARPRTLHPIKRKPYLQSAIVAAPHARARRPRSRSSPRSGFSTEPGACLCDVPRRS